MKREAVNTVNEDEVETNYCRDVLQHTVSKTTLAMKG